MHNRKTNRVLPEQKTNEILYDVITSINMLIFGVASLSILLSIYQDMQDHENDSMLGIIGKSTMLSMSLMQMFLEYKMYRHEKNKMNYHFNTLEDEINNTKGIIGKMKYARARIDNLNRMENIICNGNEVTALIDKRYLYDASASLELTYTVGEESIYTYSEKLKNLLSELDKGKELESNENYLITLLRLLHSFIPYRENILDMPTKRRFANLTAVPISIMMIFVMESLLNNLSTDTKNNDNIIAFTSLILIPICMASSIIESRILKNTTKRLDLEGFHTIRRPIVDLARMAPVGVCIPGQLTCKTGFYPNNKTLKSELKDIYLNKEKIEKLVEQNQDVVKNPKINKALQEIKNDLDINYDIESNLIHLHFKARPKNSDVQNDVSLTEKKVI